MNLQQYVHSTTNNDCNELVIGEKDQLVDNNICQLIIRNTP